MSKTVIGLLPNIDNEKRFYFDLSIPATCLNCGAGMTHDFSNDYLSYPTINTDIPLYFHCGSCDKEFETTMQVRSVEVKIEYNETLKQI